MPKIVDHAERRRWIGLALWRVIERNGMQGASVRHVAEEAGLKPSTLRYYFPDTDAMLAYGLALTTEQRRERAAVTETPTTARAAARLGWHLALPLDPDRRLESLVRFAVATSPRTPKLRRALDTLTSGLDDLSSATVSAFAPGQASRSEALRLRAFTDGLALAGVTAPCKYTPAVLVDMLDAYLTALSRPTG